MMRRRQRGASALEAAFCLPPLLMLLGVSADMGWLALERQTLDHAGRMASRMGLAGQSGAIGDAAVPLCAGGASASPRLDAVRGAVAGAVQGIIAPSRLCLAGSSTNGPVQVLALRYTAHPLVGMTPGLPYDIPLETRVMVHDAPF